MKKDRTSSEATAPSGQPLSEVVSQERQAALSASSQARPPGRPAVKIQGLWKEYRIGRIAGERTLRETLIDGLRVRYRDLAGCGGARHRPQRFWALRDVDLDIGPGEVVGIIGRNGAGKSTLLKICSRITPPTRGRVEMRGRFSSLLEVGTGFHPELTGRENIFLNGVILGMTRREIQRKLDSIVAFADVGMFLDLPVKRYSSGMYVRLAFAVAAHLDSEILLMDEVLAVGDHLFQRKCLDKMQEVASEGRTILFVSHNMSAIERLCDRCVLLDSGEITRAGPVREVVPYYSGAHRDQRLVWRRPGPSPDHSHVRSVMFCNGNGDLPTSVTSASRLGVVIECYITEANARMRLAVALYDSYGRAIFATAPIDSGIEDPTDAGAYRYRVMFPDAILMPQRYTVTISLYIPSIWNDTIEQALVLDVAPAASLGNLGDALRPGVVQLPCRWQREREFGP